MKILKEAAKRTEEDRRNLTETVSCMIEEVRSKKDEALRKYNLQFDGCTRETLRVSRKEIQKAYNQLTSQEIEDLRTAAANIRAFAKAQREIIRPLTNFSPMPGIFLGHRIIPVESCCCYVPGGNYPLYSTALMLIIPAKTAGVKRVAACSPGASHCYGNTLPPDPFSINANLCHFCGDRFFQILNMFLRIMSPDARKAREADLLHSLYGNMNRREINGLHIRSPFSLRRLLFPHSAARA